MPATGLYAATKNEATMPDEDEAEDESDLDDSDEDDDQEPADAKVTTARVGTVDLPDRMERERYFAQLNYLELSALFPGPLKPGLLAKWALAPKGSIGLVAPWVLTHRKGPTTPKSWEHDATVGDFRDSGPGRVALAQLRIAVDQLGARCVVFKSPSLFAPSAANRDRLRHFFGEVATAEAIGTTRVWVPDGLWEPRAAIAFANELGITCTIDPLVIDPNEPQSLDNLTATSLYLRVEGLGRTGPLRSERLDELLDFLQVYDDVDITVAFASPARWQDARNFKKLLEATG